MLIWLYITNTPPPHLKLSCETISSINTSESVWAEIWNSTTSFEQMRQICTLEAVRKHRSFILIVLMKELNFHNYIFIFYLDKAINQNREFAFVDFALITSFQYINNLIQPINWIQLYSNNSKQMKWKSNMNVQ